MRRGVEAQVRLGEDSDPNRFVMTVTLDRTDKEFERIFDELEDLFMRRATERVAAISGAESTRRAG